MTTDMWILGSFLIGFLLACVVNATGPVSLGMARRRGFRVGWDARERYPPDAMPRTRREMNDLIGEDNDRLELVGRDDEDNS